ncbi:MAG: hypothetical protein ACAH83_08745 [Alphaproteobacteria bacterium]
MRHFIMAAVAAACLLGASAAEAQYYYYRDAPWSGNSWDYRVTERYVECNEDVPSFGRLDRNGDDHISRLEFQSLGLSRGDFRVADRNHNGIVTRGELRAYNRSCY